MTTEDINMDNDTPRVPMDQTGWEKFRQLLHNPNNGTYLGRTPISWGKILLFYIAFYAGVLLFSGICYMVFNTTLDSDKRKPKWTLHESVIGTNPGLGFQPMSMNTNDYALIKYNPNSVNEVEAWVRVLDAYFEDYTNEQPGWNRMECTNEEKHDLCKVDVTQFDPCISSNKYGFQESKPCVFIKLNRIYGWVPEFYDNAEELPNNMPPQLKDHIKDLKDKLSPLLKNTIWVSCEDATTKEPLQNVEYFPNNRQGFPGYYYPYKNVPGYLSPLVAVKFSNLPANKEIKIACRAWAKNIKYSSLLEQDSGIVRFSLMIVQQ